MEAAGKTTLEQGAEQRQAAAEKQTNKQNTVHCWGFSKTVLVCLFLFQKESSVINSPITQWTFLSITEILTDLLT